MKFLDVRTDYAFKKVFGSIESKEILISFLNSIVYDNSQRSIIDLTITDPYNIPMIKGVKDTFVDVKAILDDGSHVIIEMQILNHKGFEKRVLYNAAKNYSVQLNTNDEYHLLNPVIALTIVDFVMFEGWEQHMSRFRLVEKEHMVEYNGDIELLFIELPKFHKSIEELDNIQDQWIYFIKNAQSLEYIPKDLDQCIQTALNNANEANLTREELEAQHKRKEFISIQKLAILKAREDGLELGIEKGIERGLEQGIEQGIKQGIKQGIEQGIERGIEQGIEQGRRAQSIEIATNLKRSGVDTETIIQATGLDRETIEERI